MSKYYSKRPENYRRNGRRYYYMRKALGMCTRCCKRPIDYTRSTTTCTQCLDQRRDYDHERRTRARAEGRCIDCGAQVEPWLREDGYSTCQNCYDKRTMSNHNTNI